MKIVQDIISTLKHDAPVKEVRIGPFWTGVHSKNCGLSSTIVTHESCGMVPVAEAGSLAEKTALELARYALSDSILQRCIGMAAVNSILDIELDRCTEVNAADVLMEKACRKKAVVVGHFPFVERLRRAASSLWVLEKRPRQGDRPAEQAPEIIPEADVVAITGTALLNRTMEELLAYCRKESFVMVLGPTAPLSSVWFDYGVDMVSGSLVVRPHEVLKNISEGMIFKQLHKNRIKLLTMARDGCRM